MTQEEIEYHNNWHNEVKYKIIIGKKKTVTNMEKRNEVSAKKKRSRKEKRLKRYQRIIYFNSDFI